MSRTYRSPLRSDFVRVLLFVSVCFTMGAGCSRCSGSRTEIPTPGLSTIQVPGLPPDPGEAGMKTLDGVDSDHDGVRDDIQRWIAIKFKDSEKKRAALRQLAIAMQQELRSVDDRIQSQQDSIRTLKAVDCMSGIFEESNQGDQVLRELESLAYNTAERSQAAIKVDKNFDGQEYRSTPVDQATSACNFDPTKLKD